MNWIVITTTILGLLASLIGIALLFKVKTSLARNLAIAVLLSNVAILLAHYYSFGVTGYTQVLLIRLSVLFATITTLIRYLLLSVQSTAYRRIKYISAITFSIAVIAVVISPWFFTGVSNLENGFASPTVGSLIFVFPLYLLVLFVASVLELIALSRRDDVPIFQQKQQLLYGLIFLLAYCYYFLLDFIYPNTVGDSRFLYFTGVINAFEALALTLVATRYSNGSMTQLLSSRVFQLLLISAAIGIPLIAIVPLFIFASISYYILILALGVGVVLVIALTLWVVGILTKTSTNAHSGEYERPTTDLTDALLDDVMNQFTSYLASEYKLSNTRYYLLDVTSDSFVEQNSDAPRVISNNHDILEAMKEGRVVTNLHNRLPLSFQSVDVFLDEIDASVAIPLSTPIGIYGIVFIGKTENITSEQLSRLMDNHLTQGQKTGYHIESILRNHYLVSNFTRK